ncbi:MAG: hypothetical protein K8E66_04995 [Phycisphaerales bacterium]|nr:hypothetical protein [Phycisphaerales bacterium]
MILVTVGAQMPFDRLVRAVDEWAGRSGRADVLAQIGTTEFEPANIRWRAFLDPEEFREAVGAAHAIVSHAGMGTIITALQHGKPALIMPRRGDLRETRNDHQIATAERFRGRPGITVAADEAELARCLDGLDSASCPERVSEHASEELLDAIGSFIAAGKAARE